MRSSKEIADIIKIEAKKKGITAKDMLEEVGLSKNAMYSLQNGNYPRFDNIIKIAEHLNISLDYVAGRKVTDVPTDEDLLIAFYRGCDIDSKNEIMKYAKDKLSLCQMAKAIAK